MRVVQDGPALTIPLQASQAPSCETTAALLQEFVKHFLFVRHQIPGLFCDLEKEVQERQQVFSGSACSFQARW